MLLMKKLQDLVVMISSACSYGRTAAENYTCDIIKGLCETPDARQQFQFGGPCKKTLQEYELLRKLLAEHIRVGLWLIDF